jgi:hypothetical protein
MEKIKATTSWMSEKYDEMNAKLFNNELGPCDFKIFTSGRGSYGGTLGWFSLNGKNLRYKNSTRQMYVESGWGDIVEIDEDNFYDICRPSIELNGNYTATENALLGTLVHEMCHYYTYMRGFCPKQGHGREFKQIGSIVSMRSNGLFTIQRLASAEEMSEYDLDDKYKEIKKQRIENKKIDAKAIFVYKNNRDVELTLAKQVAVIDDIIKYNLNRTNIVNKIIVSDDNDLINKLFDCGYKKIMRTYRYWTINVNKLGGPDFIEMYNYKTIYPKNNQNNNFTEKPKERRIFQMKCTSGIVQLDASDETTLFNKLKERFPKMSDEVIRKVMNNEHNYKTITENKQLMQRIVEKVMNKITNDDTYNEDDNEDFGIINSNMNLGEMSPFEYNNQ